MSILVKDISMPHGEDEGIMLAIYDGKAYHIGTKQEHDAVEVPLHIKTNADKIRAMTDEELARFFFDDPFRAYFKIPQENLEWLKEEVKE